MEKRLLLAFVLSALIFAGWSMLFPPPAPPTAKPPETAGQHADERADTASPDRAAAIDETADEAVEPAPEEAEAIAGEAEESAVLANDVMEVTISNRGGAVTSIRLLDFDDDEGAVLDLVQTVPSAERTLPLQLVSGCGGCVRCGAPSLCRAGLHHLLAPLRSRRRPRCGVVAGQQAISGDRWD